MSIFLDWLRAGRAPRGKPGRVGGAGRLAALGLIAAMAVAQAGCQSGLSGNCDSGCGGGGGCDSCGFFRRAGGRLFNRPSRAYSSGVIGEPATEISGPATVVTPAAPAAPVYSSGPATTTVPSTVPSVDAPSILNENPPSAKPAPVPGTSSSRSLNGSGAGRTSYTARPSATKTAVRLDSGLSGDKAPRARPARGRARDATDDATAEEDNPMDHLPPLGLPGEVTQSETASPTPPAPRPEGIAGGDLARSSGGSDEDGVSLLPADTSAEPEATAVAGAGTGIARLASVDPKLAGGSMPSAAGLAWLAEKGYRTVLDLRPSGEVSPAFIADVAARGLRYVALPVGLDTLDADRVARFQFELAAPEARPLFFFDGDGSRAGALWYIRRVTVDRVDAQLARREAEEIGLKDRAAWEATSAYVEKVEAARARPAAARAGAADPPGPATPGPSASQPGPETEPEPTADPARAPILAEAAAADGPGATFPPSIATPKALIEPRAAGRPSPSSAPAEVPSWRPFAAILLTGLGLPLAYWTRTAIPDAIARARASLPGPAPRPRSLPPESGA